MRFSWKSPFRAALAALRFVRRPRLVPVETFVRRLGACYACPHYVAPTEQCGVCTCFVRLKAHLPGEACLAPGGDRWKNL